MTPLQQANQARLTHQLNRWTRDRHTKEVYTIQQRIDRKEIVAIDDTDNYYGYTLKIGPTYFETDIILCTKMVYQHLKALGIPKLQYHSLIREVK